MKQRFLKVISLLSLVLASGAISGASRWGVYQGQEIKEMRKRRKIF